MALRGRTKWGISVASALVLVASVTGPSYAQMLDGGSRGETDSSPSTTAPPPTLFPRPTTSTTTTTTTPPPSTTEPTTPTSEKPAPEPEAPQQPQPGEPAAPGQAPPPGGPGPAEPAGEPEGDGGGTITWGTVPASAQKVIDAVPRTAANSSQALYDAVQQLVDLGLTREEAVRIGFGRFPIAGVAKYSHDWLFPRYGPGFRFHKGTDVFAPFGTPLRAVADGTVRSKSSSLGGLSVKVFTEDGTYFYYAHLSGLPDGFVEGMAVKTGDIVGFVGDSGNAKGGSPHLHFGVYPQGGEAVDPKPLLDGFLADAAAALPGIVEQVRANPPAGADPSPAAEAPSPRSLLATALLRPLTERTASASVPTEILYQTTGNPTAGGASIAQSEAQHLAGSIDWEAWETRSALGADLLRRTEAVLRLALGERRSADAAGETADG